MNLNTNNSFLLVVWLRNTCRDVTDIYFVYHEKYDDDIKSMTNIDIENVNIIKFYSILFVIFMF